MVWQFAVGFEETQAELIDYGMIQEEQGNGRRSAPSLVDGGGRWTEQSADVVSFICMHDSATCKQVCRRAVKFY